MCFPTNADEHFRSFIFHLSGCCGLMTEKGGSAPVVAVSGGFFLSDSNSLAEPRFADNPECGRFSCERGFLFFWRPRQPRLPPRTRGRGRRERSLIREDRSDAPAFPGWERCRELWAPSLIRAPIRTSAASSRSRVPPRQPLAPRLNSKLQQTKACEDFRPSHFRCQHRPVCLLSCFQDRLCSGELHHQLLQLWKTRGRKHETEINDKLSRRGRTGRSRDCPLVD